MRQHLIEIAQRIQDQPGNRPGTDKTWVLQAMWEHLLFQAEVHSAARVHAGWVEGGGRAA